MSDAHAGKNIGVWMSDKKSQKLNWKDLITVFNTHGYKVVKLDFEKPLEDHGKLDVLLHKLTDIIAASDQGDYKAINTINCVEQYLSNHPNVTVIDPLDSVRILLNRNHYYSILRDEKSFQNYGIFTPSFVEFTTNNVKYNMKMMAQHDLKFPVICKPTIAHGSKSAHEMVVIFNERGLSVCKPPCVVQNFVNHNAILHKVFLVGNRYHICERPSLKNFYSSEELEPIFYSTGEVCKADSQSTLSILDPQDKADVIMTVDESKIRHIIQVLRKKIGLLLAGFDVVLDNSTGNHAVIDINVFPSYDNFPNFFEHLIDVIDETVHRRTNNLCDNCNHYDSDCESNDAGDLLVNSLINVGQNLMKCDVLGMNID